MSESCRVVHDVRLFRSVLSRVFVGDRKMKCEAQDPLPLPLSHQPVPTHRRENDWADDEELMRVTYTQLQQFAIQGYAVGDGIVVSAVRDVPGAPDRKVAVGAKLLSLESAGSVQHVAGMSFEAAMRLPAWQDFPVTITFLQRKSENVCAEIENGIKRQVEYYLSAGNLRRDWFLTGQMCSEGL